ncbi:MAG: hypothetical protein ACI4MN_05215 [Candidatus Coproplasma sp.]
MNTFVDIVHKLIVEKLVGDALNLERLSLKSLGLPHCAFSFVTSASLRAVASNGAQ